MRVRIEPYQSGDRVAVTAFVKAIQEYELARVRGLRPAQEIGLPYTRKLLRSVAARDGLIFLAKIDKTPVGFICALSD